MRMDGKWKYINMIAVLLIKQMVAVGAEADDEKLELLFSNLKGKDLGEVLALGRERFASSGGGGGGGGVVTAASGGGGGGGAAAPPVEEKKEEKKEEKEESDDVSCLNCCFRVSSFLCFNVWYSSELAVIIKMVKNIENTLIALLSCSHLCF